MINTKKAQAGNWIWFMPFLLIILIITIGIVTGILMFYGKEYDFRKIDAEILNSKIKNCLNKNEINWTLPEEELKKEFYNACNLNQEKIRNSKVYIEILINDELKLREKDTSLCALSDKNPDYPICVSSTIKKNAKKITILTGSAQKKEEKLT